MPVFKTGAFNRSATHPAFVFKDLGRVSIEQMRTVHNLVHESFFQEHSFRLLLRGRVNGEDALDLVRRVAVHRRQDVRIDFIVTATVECPSRACATRGATPARKSSVACPCRKPCSVPPLIPARRRALAAALVTLRGRRTPPVS